MSNKRVDINLSILLERDYDEYTDEELEEIYTEIEWAVKRVNGVKYAEFIEEV